MITKIDTPALPGTESKGGSNALLWLLGLAAVGFGVYHFYLKPQWDAEDKAKAK